MMFDFDDYNLNKTCEGKGGRLSFNSRRSRIQNEDISVDQAAERDPRRELELMNSIYEDLKPLSVEGRRRVLSWVAEAHGIHGIIGKSGSGNAPGCAGEDSSANAVRGGGRFKAFADLYDAANAATNTQRALLAGYWLQQCQGQEDFVAMDANSLLKNVGANLSNITMAFDGLINTNPRQVLQVRKTGKAAQGRKQYKLTLAGIRAVERMIAGGDGPPAQ